ncbi:MAG: 3-isopropylmalate dehydratase small subunit [Chloroflexota bacterium]
MLKGKVIKYGPNINTDDIIPGRYLNLSIASTMVPHLYEDFDPTFLKRAKKGNVIVAGSNFGCGSSREHAPMALKEFGVACVIADNFARIFYRNSINIGFPLVECPDCVANTKEGDTLEVDLENGVVRNLTNGKRFTTAKYPQFMTELIATGGLVEYTKRRLTAGGRK